MKPSARDGKGSVWGVFKAFRRGLSSKQLALVMLCGLVSFSAEAALKAAIMPSYRQHLTYANAVINEPITVWGRAWEGGTATYAYALDFGDGTPVLNGVTTDPKFIGVAHSYTLAGLKTVKLTVQNNGETRECQSVIRVFVVPTQEIRVNQAIEKGLLWVYRNQTAVNATTAKWTLSNWLEYEIAATGFSLLAFEENGHLSQFNYEDDIYAETVAKGLSFLYGNVVKSAITPQASGNPDSNGNGTGAYLFNNTYANAIGVSALVMAATTADVASNTVVSAGSYAGSSLVTLVQDLFDQFGYCQGDGANLGVWRYNMNTADNAPPDGSAQQWPCLAFAMGRDRWNLLPAPWVIANAVKGFQNLQGADGSCGYSGMNGNVNSAKTGGMLVGYKMGGKGNTDAQVINAIRYLGNNWAANANYTMSPGWAGDFYAMYGIKKGLHLQEVETVSTGLGVRNWYADISAWLLGVAEGSPAALAGMPYVPNALAPGIVRANTSGFGQYADGSWIGGRGYMPNTSPETKVIGTPLAVLMLTKVVTMMGPIAVIEPVSPQPSLRPPRLVNPLPIRMDGRGSYHQDRTKSIMQYLWDFDASDGVNWSNPDARGPMPTNYGYRAVGEYTVTLCVTDDSNPTMSNKTTTVIIVTDQDVAPIAIPLPPGIDSYSGMPNQPILLDAGASFDPDGDPITNYTWDVNGNGVYGDLGDISSALPTTTVTFAGEYVGALSLQVAANGKTGNCGLSMADVYCTATDIKVMEFEITDFVLNSFADVRAVFRNAADSRADFDDVVVRFYNGNPFLGGSPIGSSRFVDLPRGVDVEIDLKLVALYGVEPQNIHVFVDSNKMIPEGNEVNNIASVAPNMRRTIFQENFETIVGNMPPGWTQEKDANLVSWAFQDGGNDVYPTNAHSGIYNAYFFKNKLYDNKTKLITPELNFGAAILDAKLTFWHCMVAWPDGPNPGQDELRVFYKTSAGGAWTLLQEYTSNVTQWTLRTINLPNVNQSYYLAFEGNAKWGRGVCVDDIEVKATGPNAYAPTIMTASPLPVATVKAPYDYQLEAVGGGNVYTWAVVSNAPPKGLGLVPATGVITGMPTVAGTTLFRVRVTGLESLYSEKTFSLTVQPAITIAGKITVGNTTTGVPGVLIALSGGGTATTDALGNYLIAVKKGWIGTVTPIPPENVEIIPSHKDYSNLLANATAQNYTYWEAAASIPLATYALEPENLALKYKSVSGTWDYWIATDDIRCVSPALSGSAAMQVTVAGPGILKFKWELLGVDGTNKLTVAVGTQTRATRLVAGEQEASVAVPAGTQIVKWTVTRGPKSPAASCAIKDVVWEPLAKVITPVPADKTVMMQADFAGLGWTGANDYCRVYTGVSATTLTLLGVYGAGVVPPGDMAARIAAAAGKTIYWRADAVRADSFGVEAVNTGTQWTFTALPNGSPEFEEPPVGGDGQIALTLGVRYELGPYAFDNSISGTVVCTVSSGIMPSGLKAEVRGGNKLYLVGVPTKAGSYTPTLQLWVKVGTVTKPGSAIQLNIIVSPLGRAAGTFDGWVDHSIWGAGTINASVSLAGAISGKVNVGGTNYIFTALSYSGETNGHFYARTDLKLSTKVLTPIVFEVWPDGKAAVLLERSPSAETAVFRNNWKETGMAALLAQRYLAYYTVALPITNGVTDLSPKGSSFLTLTVAAGGVVKVSGYLADNSYLSLSGVLLYEPEDPEAETEARARVVVYAIPSAYKGVGGVFGVLEIVPGEAWQGVVGNVVEADVPMRWWNRVPQALPGYNPVTGAGSGGFSFDLGVSGGYYNKLLNLQAFYATRELTFSGTGAPEDYEGFGNGDSGFTFASGPEALLVRPTATGFAVAPKKTVKLPGSTTLIDYANSTNVWGVTILLTKTTGLFNGSFVVYYENDPLTLQKTKALTYKGVLTPVRAEPFDASEEDELGYEGRGFYLVPDKSYYRDALNVLKYYTFSWSFDVQLESEVVAP